MLKKAWLMLGCMTVLLTSCGEKPELDENNGFGKPMAPAVTQTEPKAPTPSDNDSQTKAEPTPEQEGEPAHVKKEYRLSKAFTVVPKKESGNRNKNVVLLTFDDGPKEREMVEKMLDILDKHGAKAIFFVNGYRVEQNPDLLKMIHDRGQVIGNHAWDHVNLKELSREEIDRQIEDVQNIVEELTGKRPQFFRPPHGASNQLVLEKVKEEQMLFMTWSTGSEDWVKKYFNPESVIQNVLSRLHPGSNILMHELPWTVEALDTLLTKIKEAGYAFVDPNAIEIE